MSRERDERLLNFLPHPYPETSLSHNLTAGYDCSCFDLVKVVDSVCNSKNHTCQAPIQKMILCIYFQPCSYTWKETKKIPKNCLQMWIMSSELLMWFPNMKVVLGLVSCLSCSYVCALQKSQPLYKYSVKWIFACHCKPSSLLLNFLSHPFCTWLYEKLYSLSACFVCVK